MLTFSEWMTEQFALGILTIIPCAVLLAFDLVLYICRMSLYEFPVLGGRARGMQRPRLSGGGSGGGGNERSGAGSMGGGEMGTSGGSTGTGEKKRGLDKKDINGGSVLNHS